MRIVPALLLAIAAAAPASAQVVRYDRSDPMTDRHQLELLAPSRDGRSVLHVACDGVYGLRSLDFSGPGRTVTGVLMRFDRDPPIKGSAMQLPGVAGTLLLTSSDPAGVVHGLQAGKTLAIRVSGDSDTDIGFDLTMDSKAAFAGAAEVRGVPRHVAEVAWETMTVAVSRAVAGQDADVVTLFAAAKIPLRENGKVRDTAALMGPFLLAMARTGNPATFEDAGAVVFGAAIWPALRPLVKGYGTLNQPMAAQYAWLVANCPTK